MPNVLDRRELTITRLFDAPRRLVFACWTEPERLAIWWGPAGFSNPVCRVDARAGGEIDIVMQAPDGQEFPMSGSFREVVPPERLVFISRALGPNGEPLLEGLTTVTLEEVNGKTKMTLHTEATAIAPIAIGMLQGMEAGWTQSIEKLAGLVASSS
ncbi:SRPBCC domain-containing protein [Kaistia algarum]|uniref:SRPBCC family protein n=1 Tax=Kaistia algarum TaxID=2083279 RepID=UPI000CE88C6C|nr:SRPBCC domain-containing protein [Kaistia algarum]MCX5512708.1 SRPBCC domain-containing protein [Kaistia algarum]PPE82040.1 SRPBCC domain-containing protein [Kaistia algarum]